jgi:hypothetical protein
LNFNIKQQVAKINGLLKPKTSNPRTNLIHFLHIGKTGGTAIRSALENHLTSGKYNLEFHRHGTSLREIPEGEKVVFFIRDPISRFISGFYSRQRKGQPRYFFEWNKVEEEAFTRFATPNDLAMALANKDSEHYAHALNAMDGVQHTRHYRKWLISRHYLKSREDDILLIGFQESLSDDFDKLKGLLVINDDVVLPKGIYTAHRSPDGLDRALEEAAVVALRKWYQEDYELVALCKEMMSRN